MMKYFVTFFWTFLLIQMVTYVVTSMLGTAFDFKTGSILAVIVTVLIYVLGVLIPDTPTEKEAVH